MGLLVEDVAAARSGIFVDAHLFISITSWFIECRMRDGFVILISKPCTTPRVVSLPSKSVAKRFRTFFDILEVFDFDLWLGPHKFPPFEPTALFIYADPSEKKGGETKHGNHRNFRYARSQRASVSRCKANISVLSVLLVWKNLYTFAAEKSKQEKGEV